MQIKIKDIANKLGVSSATVSMVINNKRGISEATRQRVIQVLKENGYATSGIKSVITKSGTINLIIYKKHSHVLSNTPFFSELIEGIEYQVKCRGYKFTMSYYDSNNIDHFLKTVNSQAASEIGILLLGTEMLPDDISLFKDINIPLVLLDSHTINTPVNEVLINNEQGAFLATDYLIKQGHRKIGYLHGKISINNFVEREEGYKKALVSSNIPINENYTVLLDSTIDGAYQDMTSYLDKSLPLPTAFFSDNDIIAYGAMKALKEHNISIPEDVSIIGFDDTPFDTISDPPLSTVKVLKREMGLIAADRLIQIIENGNNYITSTRIDTQLILRDSVKKISCIY